MSLDLSQNFVSAQHNEIKLTDFYQNFIYAFILTRSMFGLLHVIFRIFVLELWSLIYAKFSFPLNILRINRHNFTKFYICIDIDKNKVGIISCYFSQVCRVIFLDLPQNFISAQYLVNKVIVHHILYMHLY